MTIDYTKILQKISPTPDGESVLRLRTGTVTAVNSGGTVDVADGAGVVTPFVPYLSGVIVSVGMTVQILSYRGSMLVIGKTASVAPAHSALYDEVTSDQTTTSSAGTAYLEVTLPSAGDYAFEVLWTLSNDGAGSSTLGFSIGGTATLSEYRWASVTQQHGNASGSEGQRASGTSYPATVVQMMTGVWTIGAGLGSMLVKGRVSVTSGGTLQFKIGRFSGTGTITTWAGSNVTVRPVSVT